MVKDRFDGIVCCFILCTGEGGYVPKKRACAAGQLDGGHDKKYLLRRRGKYKKRGKIVKIYVGFLKKV